MKKLILGLIILLVLSGCIPISMESIETPIVVKNGDVLPERICKNIDEVIVIHKTGCPACATAMPRLGELEKEFFKTKFVYYNTVLEKERTELLSLGFVPTHVPAVVIDCKVYEGALSKNKYKELIEEWLAD